MIKNSFEEKIIYSISEIINDLIIESTDETSLSKSEQFLKDLEELSLNILNLKSQKKGSYTYQKSVELFQTALEILGYKLPKYGVDGLFGPETKQTIINFQTENDLPPTGEVDSSVIKKLYELVKKKGVSDDLISKYILDFTKIGIGTDDDFYKAILNGLGAPITEENIKFLYAWRQAEGGQASNNPFNTTYKLYKDDKMTNYNNVGVKNYSTPAYGIEATIRTLKNPRYSCITDGLINNIGPDNIAKCKSLETWGTGTLVSKVVGGYLSGASPKPKLIPRAEIKSVQI